MVEYGVIIQIEFREKMMLKGCKIKVMSSVFGVRSIETKYYVLSELTGPTKTQGFKRLMGREKILEHKPLNPRILDPLNPLGVTLIELIAVMAVIGILAVTVLPKIDFGATSSQTSVDGAAYIIASDIRYAQEFAMANRTSKTVTFSAGGNTYTFNPANNLDPTGQLPSGATTTALTLTFNSLGEPTTGGGGTVTVSAGGVSRTITVLQYTGKVN